MFQRWLALLVAGAILAGCGPSTPQAPDPTQRSTTWTPQPTGSTQQPAPTSLRPRPSATAPSSQSVGCDQSLQSLVDTAPPRSTLVVPPCLYRETVRVAKALTLEGSTGAEIRGSDVWEEWVREGDYWRSALAVPEFPSHGECREGTERCDWPEQLFIDDQPLLQQATGRQPGPGQFALASDRRVVLGDDPTGRLVEVTTRRYWLVPLADGINIHGFRMRHAANDSQEGAITDGDYEVWIRDSVLSDTHGAVVSLSGAGGIVGSDIFRGGQLGIHRGGTLVRNNRIHDNNTEDFSSGWEAGGLKAANIADLVIDGNEIFDNSGPGIWIDIRSRNVTISDNRVYGNDDAGIYYEISSGGRIFDNVVWANSLDGPSGWVTGAGILLHTSGNTEVYGNVVAWNGDGIGFQSQDRDDRPKDAYMNNVVRDNVIVQEPGDDTWALAWAQDWDGPLFATASNNRGYRNRYWFPAPEGDFLRFAWDGVYASLAEFNETPGEEGGRYLTMDERDALLGRLGIPLDPP